MADVFLSYAREDQRVAEQLARTLEAQGLSVWWDRQIVAGHSFDDVIERELESAAGVIVLWSDASVQSEWVRAEASAAAERGVLVPANIAPVRPPLEFRRKQTVDLAGWHGDTSHPGFRQLLQAVRLHGGHEEPEGQVGAPAADAAPQGLKWRGPLIALALIGVLAAAAYGLRDAPEPETPASTAVPAPQPAPRTYAWKLNLSNIDDDVYVEVNSIQRLKKAGGATTLDLTPFLTGGNDRVYVRLGNGNCFGSSLHAQFLRDGKPMGTPARHQVAVSHCGWQLDWEWIINKSSGALSRVK